MRNHVESELRHEKFIKEICESGIVWGLENEEGFASSSSTIFNNSEGNPAGLVCFWSDTNLAKSCAEIEWSGYKLVEVALSDFIENLCVEISTNGLMVGTNFNHEMFGFEADPIDLVIEIESKLKDLNKEIILENYNGIAEVVARMEE